MKIKTRYEVLTLLADERRVIAADVAARVLRAKVWISGAGSPGCLYDSGPYCHATKQGAIDSCTFLADDSETGVPRGMVTSLRRAGSYTDSRGWRYEISQSTIGSIL